MRVEVSSYERSTTLAEWINVHLNRFGWSLRHDVVVKPFGKHQKLKTKFAILIFLAFKPLYSSPEAPTFCEASFT